MLFLSQIKPTTSDCKGNNYLDPNLMTSLSSKHEVGPNARPFVEHGLFEEREMTWDRERLHERMRSQRSDPNFALAVVWVMDGPGFRRTLKVDTHTNTQRAQYRPAWLITLQLTGKTKKVPLNIKHQEIDGCTPNGGQMRKVKWGLSKGITG